MIFRFLTAGESHGKCLNAIIEENHDENGIIWPMEVAPYKVAIVVSNMNHERMCEEAEKLYSKLTTIGIETLYDDRKETIGVKLNDMELIGIPIVVTIGNNIENQSIEIKLRNKDKSKEVKINKALDYINDFMRDYNKK